MTKVGKQLVKPETLPSTTDSARQHYFRVYGQIQEWLGNDLAPSEWGWKLVNGKFLPLLMGKQLGPSYLLKYVHCGCKEDGCKANSCSCRSIGLPCTLTCKKCNGVSCQNQANITDED